MERVPLVVSAGRIQNNIAATYYLVDAVVYGQVRCLDYTYYGLLIYVNSLMIKKNDFIYAKVERKMLHINPDPTCDAIVCGSRN